MSEEIDQVVIQRTVRDADCIRRFGEAAMETAQAMRDFADAWRRVSLR